MEIPLYQALELFNVIYFPVEQSELLKKQAFNLGSLLQPS